VTAVSQADKYRQIAEERFDLLKAAYSGFGGPYLKLFFWKFGNSFDTMIDFLDIDSTGADTVTEMVSRQFTESLKALGGYDSAWFDDFGWWTVATQRALARPYFNADSKRQFADILSNCWKRFTDNAPYVWDRGPQQRFLHFRPAVSGGVWNNYWEGTDNKYLGPRGDPTSGDLGGIQNTVTNTVYLIAAQRLAVEDPGARTAAQREYSFLSEWLWSQQPALRWNPPNSLATATLIRERVSHFFNSTTPAPGFQSDWAWTGDQGLILGAITDRMNEDDDGRLMDLAKGLLLAARTTLTNKSGVLGYCTTTGSVPNDDTRDYCTGPGVFWRNALHAWNSNGELRACMSGAEYQTFIGANADAVVAETAWPANDDELDQRTNDVAVLVAALSMLKTPV
jgi:hypothetical protein